MSEVFTFEVILHCSPEYDGSINSLKSDLRQALKDIEGVDDIEIALTARETV